MIETAPGHGSAVRFIWFWMCSFYGNSAILVLQLKTNKHFRFHNLYRFLSEAQFNNSEREKKNVLPVLKSKACCVYNFIRNAVVSINVDRNVRNVQIF